MFNIIIFAGIIRRSLCSQKYSARFVNTPSNLKNTAVAQSPLPG